MSKAIMWFRQDLRINDNLALIEACNNHNFVLPVYILDETNQLLGGAQKWWLHHSLIALNNSLQKLGLTLCLLRGNPLEILSKLAQDNQIDAIYWNRCYEPRIIQRDTLIKKHFTNSQICVHSSNGSLLFEPWEIKNTTGGFFKVFTPFWKSCLKQLKLGNPPTINNTFQNLRAIGESLDSWNLLPQHPNWAFEFDVLWQPGESGALIQLENFIQNNILDYDRSRDEPYKNSTSKLSPHLHFGEINPQQILRAMSYVTSHEKSVERFLAEIGWREFSYHLLYHFPGLPTENFKSDFNNFPWQSNSDLLKKWQNGQTGYPIVDAGMRELWHTGYMQNRCRMIVASFLTKDLLIDWREGAAWFLDTLVDADLASNSASWQWVAGCGADAAPYFRIFNPILQGEKFDPNGEYVKKWIPELRNVPIKWIHKPWMAPPELLDIKIGREYPLPIVDHIEARNRALLAKDQINHAS